MLLPTGRLLAEDADPAEAGSKPAQMNISDLREQPIFQVAETAEQFAGTVPADNVWLEFEEVEETRILGARLGWWGTFNSGSLTKTGEYQGLHPSSPFVDFDGLISNGNRTLDFSATLPENEASQAYLHFYGGPRLTANVDYESFLHRLDHVPLDAAGWNTVGNTNPNVPVTTPFYGQDLNVGRDYAIQVQQLKANFKGELTENVRWRLNLWGMEKTGNRDATAVTHCFGTPPPATNNSRCHLQGQSQKIDWLTQQIEPVIEWRVTEGFTLEYSRTMRTFQQNDQVVLRDFRANEQWSPGTYPALPPLAYDLVPESSTQIDRIKVAADLGMSTDLYVLGYNGDNSNNFRDTNRHFAGTDVRITNTAIDGLSVTGYGKVYTEHTSTPSTPLGAAATSIYQEANLDLIDPAIDRDEGAVGAKGRWRPFHDCELDTLERGLSLDGGYEYRDLRRSNVTYDIEPGTTRSFTQPSTISNRFFVGASEEWTREFSTTLRYTMIKTGYPLIGVTGIQENADINTALNTNLPTDEHRIELGGTWNLADNLMLNGTFYVERTYNHIPSYANFDEDNYPFVLSAWYAPTARWSMSGGYSQLTNWINQDITMGDKPGATNGTTIGAWTSPWQYMAKSDVVTLSTSYAATECLTVTGGAEYVRGVNAITNAPSPATATAAGSLVPGGSNLPYNNDLINYSRVEITTWRLSAGADYLLRRGVSTFFRYNYFDYRDATQSFNIGTTSNILVGLTGTY